jgi:hypothetical protein
MLAKDLQKHKDRSCQTRWKHHRLAQDRGQTNKLGLVPRPLPLSVYKPKPERAPYAQDVEQSECPCQVSHWHNHGAKQHQCPTRDHLHTRGRHRDASKPSCWVSLVDAAWILQKSIVRRTYQNRHNWASHLAARHDLTSLPKTPWKAKPLHFLLLRPAATLERCPGEAERCQESSPSNSWYSFPWNNLSEDVKFHWWRLLHGNGAQDTTLVTMTKLGSLFTGNRVSPSTEPWPAKRPRRKCMMAMELRPK